MNETRQSRRTAEPAAAGPAASSTTCRVCGAPVKQFSDAFPFCSRRCRLVDLGRWFSGQYHITRPLDPQDENETDSTS